MDSRIAIALENAKRKRSGNNVIIKENIMIIKPIEWDEDFYDIPFKESKTQKKSPIDLIDSIMNKPAFDLSKVNEEMQREMEKFQDKVSYQGEQDPIKTLGIV
jgi:hypothetical protein